MMDVLGTLAGAASGGGIFGLIATGVSGAIGYAERAQRQRHEEGLGA